MKRLKGAVSSAVLDHITTKLLSAKWVGNVEKQVEILTIRQTELLTELKKTGGGGLDGGDPAIPHPTPAEESVAAPSTPENPTGTTAGNFHYHGDHSFMDGGPKAKFNANLAAVRTYKQVLSEGRHATAEEQAEPQLLGTAEADAAKLQEQIDTLRRKT